MTAGAEPGSIEAAGLVRLLSATVEVVADCDALVDHPSVRSATHDAAMALLALGSTSDADTFAESLRALAATADMLTRAAAGGGAVPTDC